MLTKHPDLNGIWAVWDVPAEGVLAAARSAGRSDLVVTTEDLGKNVAISLAKNDLVKGLGAQRPFDQGVTEARLAADAMLGKQAPPYVALQALPVTHANVLDAWKQVYHADARDLQILRRDPARSSRSLMRDRLARLASDARHREVLRRGVRSWAASTSRCAKARCTPSRAATEQASRR